MRAGNVASVLVTLPTPPPPRAQTPAIVVDLVTIPGGPFLAQPLACGDPYQHARLRSRIARDFELPSFRIDRHVATCDDYNHCVDAGACTEIDSYYSHCKRGIVTASFAMATAYCAWRGAKLQSYAQWQRAARGTDGRRYPDGWSKPTDCVSSGDAWSKMSSCVRTSPAGMVYTTRDLYGEWTRDHDCIDSSLDLLPRAVKLYGDDLTGGNVYVEEAEIRCVRE
jgi:formylglycine-generating enzyme required for sulfatase activity